MYLYKYIYIGGLLEYISKKVAAYGQFVLVFSLSRTDLLRGEFCIYREKGILFIYQLEAVSIIFSLF